MVVTLNYFLPSNIGLASNICCSIQECLPLMAAKYCKINFVLSVFPAPLSPLKNNVILSQFEKFNITSMLLEFILPDNNTLVVAISLHVSISIISDSKYVGWKFSNFFILVKFYLLRRIYGKNLIWIYSY